MKPISIRFQCFGPYMDEQFLDFTQLEPHGLFLICGETGAGKTTILDAICYALYNQSSGSTRGKGLAVMRCKQAQKTDITLVEFLFSCAGTRYKFRRTLEYKRKNARDEHQCWEERNGEFVPLFENPKDSSVTAKAQALIGLTYEQFRQVIILPQGKFETLLISDSEEKEKILVTLFHASRWQRIADELYRRVRDRDTALRLQRQQCENKLAEYGCQTVDELQSKLMLLQQNLADLNAQSRTADAQAAALQAEKEQAMLIAQAFQNLKKQQDLWNTLLLQVPSFDLLEEKLRAAAAAQTLRPQYDQYRRLCQARSQAETELAQCRSAQQTTQDMLSAVQARQRKQADARMDYEAAVRQYALLESKTAVYTALEAQKLRAEEAANHLQRKASFLHAQERAFLQAHQHWLDEQARQTDAIAAYQTAQAQYLQGIGGVLARSLRPGIPCPVCGSIEHPAPAACAAEHISEAQLEALNQGMKSSAAAVSAAAAARQKAEHAKEQAADAYHAAQQETIALQKAYELSLEQRVAGLETLSQLNAELQRLHKSILSFEADEEALQQDLQAAVSSAAAARSRLDAAEETLAEAVRQQEESQAKWVQALVDSGFENQKTFEAAYMAVDAQARQQERLTQFRRDLANAEAAVQEHQEVLRGQSEPNLDDMTQILRSAQEESQRLQARLALETDRFSRMQNDLQVLTNKLQSCALERIQTDADLEFAERLRGSRGLSLQRYVLGVMLSSIAAEANRLLQTVYGGRYQLFRSQELGDRRQKSGLDLEVLDHTNGQRRSVKTLSGGEQFLVALSLAIGLSTVVQSQGSGIRMEAMFIDEGFGSLDRDAIQDALEILDGIRKGSGLVGIISHVDQLAESIPAKIEVRKGTHGSRCTVNC